MIPFTSRIVPALVCAALAFTATPTRADTVPGSVVAILSYHDVSDDLDPYELTVSVDVVREQIREAREAGWTFFALSDLLRRLELRQPLPRRALALTFDDGYRSFLTEVLPLLEEERVPAALAVISSVPDSPPIGGVPYLTWDEIRRVDASEWVEVVSHSHDLHRWIENDPQGDTSPAVSTRWFVPEENRYETRTEYVERIREDLARSRQVLASKLGHDVTTLVWPFGHHNRVARDVSRSVGFRWALGLGDRAATAEDVRTRNLPRFMVVRGTSHSVQDLERSEEWWEPVRAAQVDIDALYDEDLSQFRRNVDALVQRVHDAGATHVILQACADPAGDALFRESYFMNHQLPVKADVWTTVATRFHHAGLRVWIRAPVMNLSWEWLRHPEWRVRRDRAQPRHDGWYFRLTPDLPEARRAARDFFGDISVYLPIDGVLFDDDAFMLPDEILSTGSVLPEEKSRAIHALIAEVMDVVRAWRPKARFGRNLYAPVVEHEGVHPLFAQDFDRFVRDYDLTVVMAYPWMEGQGHRPVRWVRRLSRLAAERGASGSPAPVMIKLQTYDWDEERWLGAGELKRLVREALRAGIAHVGLYPLIAGEGALPRELLGEVEDER